MAGHQDLRSLNLVFDDMPHSGKDTAQQLSLNSTSFEVGQGGRASRGQLQGVDSYRPTAANWIGGDDVSLGSTTGITQAGGQQPFLSTPIPDDDDRLPAARTPRVPAEVPTVTTAAAWITTPAADDVPGRKGGRFNTRPMARSSSPPAKTTLAAAAAAAAAVETVDEHPDTKSRSLAIGRSATQTKPRCLSNAVGTNHIVEFLLMDNATRPAVATEMFPVPETAASPREARLVAEDSTVATAMAAPAAAPTAKKPVRRVKKPRPRAAKDDEGPVRRIRRERNSGGTGPSSGPAGTPEGVTTYTYSSPCWVECKRAAFDDLARADKDLVGRERDFLSKDARFIAARAAHAMAHDRWVRSRATTEAARNASKGYVMAEDRARREHMAACRNKRAAEAGVMEAMDNSALAQVAVMKAADVLLHTTSQQRMTFHCSRDDLPTAGMTASSFTRGDLSSGGLASFGEGSATKGPKRPRSDTGETNGIAYKTPPNPPTAATTSNINNNTICPDNAPAEVTHHVVGGGNTIGARVHKQEDGYNRPIITPVDTRATTTSVGIINALPELEEAHTHAEEGFQTQRRTTVPATSRAAAAAAASAAAAAAAGAPVLPARAKKARRTAQGSNPAPPALEVAQQGAADTPPSSWSSSSAVAVALAVEVAERNVNEAVESAKRASAFLGAAKATFGLSAAVRNEAETAAAHRHAVNNARPFVSWVTNEVAAQRRLQDRAAELMSLASRAWSARDEARKEALKAAGRVSRVARVFESFSSSDWIDEIVYKPLGGGDTNATNSADEADLSGKKKRAQAGREQAIQEQPVPRTAQFACLSTG